jgi:hypothetical protein
MEFLPDLIEESLTLVHRESGVSDQTFCDIAAALYALEGRYHHTSTQFRLREVLVERGYLLEVPIERHPECHEAEASLEEAAQRDPAAPTPVMQDPTEPWDGEENPVAGFLMDDMLIVEVGSSLWRRLRDDRDLETDGPTPSSDPESFEALAEAVDIVTRTADEAGDIEVLLGWYSALGYHATRDAGSEGVDDASELTEHAALRQIRERLAKVDDLAMKMADPSTAYDLPPRELRQMHPFLGWWYSGVGF